MAGTLQILSTGCTVENMQECKVLFKYCQKELAWQKEIKTTHINRHYKKCLAKHEVIG